MGWIRDRFAPLAWLGLTATGCDQTPTGPPRVASHAVRAITLADWTPTGYGTTTALGEVAALASTGASSMWIVVTGYQENTRTAVPRNNPSRTPTLAAVRHAAEEAQSLGLDVVIKPHIDVDDGTWRGRINPRNAAQWFDAYRDFMLPWADLAQELGATHFVVGTELAKTLQHEQHWRSVIAQLRERFSGALTYAASWDEATRVGFWDALDVVGVDAYFPVAKRHDAGRAEILAGWQKWLDVYERLHERTQRHILFTEVGYRSIDGAGIRPYEFDNAGELDLQEQADLYWAAMEATSQLSWVDGIVWWNWLASGAGGPQDRDYTPSGKPAMDVLASAWRGI